MSGGVLDADKTSTVSGALTQSGDIVIDVADNKTLTYSGAAISLGANTLTLIGGGTLSNTNSLVLNNADSLLSLSGILTIRDVDGTAASNSGKGIQVTSSATLGEYDLSAVSYLSLAANKTLAGQLNLQSGGELKTSGDGQYIGDIALAGGKFSATDSQVLGGTLSITADSELKVSQGYTLTLSQSGGLALGANTLTISGGGSLVSGGLTLDNASSKLLLNSITVDNVSSMSDSLGLDVDADSTVTSLSVANITPVAIASGSSLSGGITVSAGSLKLSEAGTLASTISMSGGVLDADESSTVSGALSHTADITIDVASGKTLTYSGAAISLGANTLTLSGGGSLVSGGLTLNNASSKLLLNSITVDSVSTLADSSSGGLDVDDNSTVSSLSVAHITPVSIALGKTLSGAITLTDGSIKLAETGTLASTISMSGGVLDADESSTVSGALSHTADITVDVADNKTLTYSGAAISLGANTLTLSGGGSLVSGGLTLNNASSKLLLNSITVDNVSTTSDSLGLDVDADSTVTSLSVANITPVSIAGSNILSGAITVTGGSLKLTEAGTVASTIAMSGGTLDADETSTVSGALSQSGNITIDVADTKKLTYSGGNLNVGSHTLSIGGAGTFSNAIGSPLVLDVADSILNLTDNGTISGPVKLESGTLKSAGSPTVSGVLTQYGDSTIEIAETKTLTYEGGAIEIGASALSIIGGGIFANNGSALELNNAASQLKFSRITVDYIRATADSLGIVVDNTSTVTNFTVGHVTPVSILPNQSFNGLIEVYSNSNLQLNNTGTLAADVKISGLGGKLEVQDNMTFTGSLQQVDLHEGFELIIASGKTMKYSGSEFDIGNHTFKLSGGGTLDNTNYLKLNDPASLLAISDSTKISRMQVSAHGSSGGLNITASDDNSTGNLVGNLSLSDSFSVSSDSVWSVDNITADTTLTFSTDKNVNFGALTLTGRADFSLGTEDITLSVSSPVTVGNTQKLQNGGGSFNFLGGLSLETGSELIGQGKQVSGNIVLNGGQIATEQNTVLTDNLTHSADSTLQIDTSKTLTYSGAVVDIGTSELNIQGGGSFINSAVSALSLNNADSHLVLDNVTVGFVTASAASNSSKGLKVSVNSTLTNLSMTEKLRLSVDSGKTLTIAETLTVPTQGMDLAGAGTLDLSDNFTLNGDVTLASGGSLTIDARGLQLNLGGDLNLVGGVLLTDNTTYFHLLANSTLTTNAEQTVANVTIPANEAPMLTLGYTTILKVIEQVAFGISCPQSLPIKPKAQLRLSAWNNDQHRQCVVYRRMAGRRHCFERWNFTGRC